MGWPSAIHLGATGRRGAYSSPEEEASLPAWHSAPLFPGTRPTAQAHPAHASVAQRKVDQGENRHGY